MDTRILKFAEHLTLCFALSFSAVAGALQVKVDFDPAVERYLPRINATEQQREDNFRQLHTNAQGRFNSIFTFNRERLQGTKWAGERLIGDINQYTVENLLQKLVEDNLSRLADTEIEGSVTISVSRIRVSNYPLPRISGGNTYIEGEIRWFDVQGRLLQAEQLRTNLVKVPVLDQPYDGAKYAFAEPDENNRIGPVVSQFVEQGLERLFPEHADQIHGPVLVLFASASGGRVVFP